ncbi:DUF6544 family protein [Sphingomonas psychrolutea]|uniref:Uncharacterized protein n=1 Tax=Sphingomonas psychrolutea TaxID=1259676 RepID=A0ABQ1H7M0_9SPHN|nr:DUF6544 family protein [Sphingomonas psychrolutea]GGA60340.1 hypothetical protein GCM10011395_33410 [Sphingomonas psychrolutea]
MNEVRYQNRLHIPDAAYDLAIRLGVKPQDNPVRVSLEQTGRMKRNLNSEAWITFTAAQTISTRACEFDWVANAGPFGMISARDALDHGEGRLDVMALGIIPIARAEHTPALVRGELMRYLAELAWAPDAILANPSLRWRGGWSGRNNRRRWRRRDCGRGDSDAGQPGADCDRLRPRSPAFGD